MTSSIDWADIVWEARGFLGLDDDEPVPRDELIEQAKANGWGDREIREALRETDAIKAHNGDIDKLVLGESVNHENTETEADFEPSEGGGDDKESRSPNGNLRDEELEQCTNLSERAHAAFADAIEFYHEQLDTELPVDYAETARDYYGNVREWSGETIAEKRLGYAPADCKDELVAYLFDKGHERDAIQASGLFYEGELTPHFNGRFVLPYFDENGEPVYAISRSLDEDNGGHPADHHGDQKYTKVIKSKEYSEMDEPIYGLDTVRDDEPVLITEGIADAITAHQAGYPCVSPVTVQFKHSDREVLRDAFDDRGVDQVYLIQDAERPTSTLDDEGRLTIQQFGDGIKGAVKTAAYLSDHGIDARVADLPRPGLDKVDLDDYIRGWTDDLTPLLASAAPVDEHPAYDGENARDLALDAAKSSTKSYDSDGEGSALFDLDIQDVSGLSTGYRGKNPLGHHGDSENYFLLLDDQGVAYDHKYKVAYTPLTFILADAGERRPGSPNGSLDDSEIFEAWKHAKDDGLLVDDDPIPRRALRHVARNATDWDGDLVEHETRDGESFEGLPREVYNAALNYVQNEYDLNPGRDQSSDFEEDTEPAEALLDQEVVVEPANALRAAEAVDTDDLDERLPELEREDVDDVAIAVGLAEGVIDSADEFPENGRYTECYYRARDHYGAPLPKYLDSSTLEERHDLVFAALSRITPAHIIDDIKSEVTVEEPDGKAIAKINPTWEDSESGERILAGYGSGFMCLEHAEREKGGQKTFSPLQFVAVENDLISFEYNYPRGEEFKQAYTLMREEYGAPLPKWRATVLEHFAVLPPAVDVVDEASAKRSLSDVHGEVEDLIRDALTVRDRAQLVTVFPGGGKTYSTAKAAADTPLVYLAGRNELKEQIEEYAHEVTESDDTDAVVSVEHLPILAENQIQDEALLEAVGVVREEGFSILEEREELLDSLDANLDKEDEETDDENEITGDVDEETDDDIDIERATCPAAEGEHDDEWRLAVQVARQLGIDPSTIHKYDTALFGDELPCRHDGDCEYTEGWESVRNPDDQADILIGSPGHAYVDSATTYFEYDQNGDRTTSPRAVVIDEFPEDQYFNEFDTAYMDHATWLAEAVIGADTREDVIQSERDVWLDRWLAGDGDENGAAETVIDQLQAGEAIADARANANRVLDKRDLDGLPGDIDAAALSEDLEALANGSGVSHLPDLDAVLDTLTAAVDDLTDAADRAYGRDRDRAGRLYAAADDLEDVSEKLDDADRLADELSTLDQDLADSLDLLPVDGDLRALCEDAVDVIRGDDDRTGLLSAAAESLKGGRNGCEQLAIYANDGYAHPDAWKLLAGAVADTDDKGVSEVSTAQFSFDDEGEGGTYKRLTQNDAVIAACRDHKGAVVSDTPAFTDITGGKCPVVGLDATGRSELWRLAIGRDTERRDIHDSAAERRGFLRDVMNLRVVRTSETANAYYSDPAGKNFGEDLELVDTVTDEFTGHGPDVIDTQSPAVITSKKVIDYLREPLADALGIPPEHTDEDDSPLVNFGGMKGSDALGDRQVGVILGSPHYGDEEPEKWALLAGEDAGRNDTYGMNLDYGSETANAYLKNMREDHVMQAILRAGRNDDATVVFTHTAALRDDLPVDYQAPVLSAHSKGALTVIDAAKGYQGEEFTVQDITEAIRDDQDAVDERQVRNILSDFAGDGYLRQVREGGAGVAHEYELDEDPGTADIELPEPDLPERGDETTSEKSRTSTINTWNFRSPRDIDDDLGSASPSRPTIPAREAAAGGDPPPQPAD